MTPKSMPLIFSTLGELVIPHSPLAAAGSTSGLDLPMALAGAIIFKTRASARLLAAAALAISMAALAPQPAAAATISWGTPTTVSGDTDVATTGAFICAYTGGGTGGTVNGEIFTAGNSGTAWGANVTLTSFGSSYSSFGGNTSSPWSGLSASYQSVLQCGAYGGAAAGTVTLNNLTAGHSYIVQIWVNDSRSGVTGRTETTGGSGDAVTLTYNSLNAQGGVGQYSIGYFVADSTSQSFTLTPNSSGSVQLNALSLRDNGSSPKAWVGASSTSWGTAANWNPSYVPSPVDSVLFNSSSTANLATTLDTSHTIGALTLNNAAAAVSIGYDGNTLTINGGINLLGASQNLTIGDPLVLGTSQTWNATNSGDALAVNGGVSGSAALTITGAGAVSFGGAATYTGNTTISGGNLTLGGGGSITSASANVSVTAGGFLTNNGTITTASISVAAGGSLTDNGTITSASISVAGGSLTENNSISGANNITVTAGGSLTDNGSISSATISVATNSTLALSGSGYISGTPTLALAGGATFDVSAANSASFSGTLTNTSTGAVLNGNNNCSGATFSMLYDGVNPPFIQTNGPLTLPGNTINVNNTGAALVAGNSTIIAAAQAGNIGQVTGSLPLVTVTGNGTVAGPYGVSLQIDGLGDLQLVVATPDVWIGTSDNSWANAVNWLSGNTPSTSDSVQGAVLFNNQSTAAHLSTVLNSDFIINGVTVINPPGPVTIGGGNTLEIATGGINLASASQDLTISAPMNVPDPGNWNIAAGRNLNITGGATGGSGPTIVGAGSVNLNSPVTFSGTTTVASGSDLKMTTPNVLSSVPSSTLAIYGLLDLNGESETIDSLSGTGIVDNRGTAAATLTLGAGGDGSSFNGIIQNTGGSLALMLTNGSATLNGVNTYSGGTTISNVDLNLSFINQSPYYSYALGTGPLTIDSGATYYETYGVGYNGVNLTNAINLNGGWLRIGGANAHEWNFAGPLTVMTNSTLFTDGSTGYRDSSSGYIGYAMAVSGPVTMGTNTLQTGGAGSEIVIAGNISGTGNIIAGGAGFNGAPLSYVSIFELAGSNSFSGTIRAAGGTVYISSQYCAQNATLDLSNPADAGAFLVTYGNALIGGITGVNNFNLNAALQIGNNNQSTTYGGAMTNSGSLTKIGSGTLTLTNANTYTGSTTVSGGTLALSGSGSVASTTITVAGGATLDVSGKTTTLALGSGYTLANSSVGAVLAGTNNCSGGALSLVYNSLKPCFIQTNGGMTISGATTITVTNTGGLLAGTNVLIAATTGSKPGKVYGTVPSVTLTGSAALGAASLLIDSSGNLDLVISGTYPVWTGASGTSWNTGGDWQSGVVPPAGTNVIFNYLSTANLATVLNANFNLNTLSIDNPSGPVSIGGANTLTLTNGINMAGAGQPLTLTAPVVLGAVQTWTVGNTSSGLTVSNLSGSSALTLAGGGTVVLNGTNTTTGGTIIENGSTVKFTGPGNCSFPPSGTIYVLNNAGAAGTGTIDLGGLTQTSTAYVSFPYSTTTTLTNGTLTDNAAPTAYPNSDEDYNFMGTINLAPNANYISNRRFVIGYHFNGFTTTINSLNGSTSGSLTWGGDSGGNQSYIGVGGDSGTLNINGGTVNFTNATSSAGSGYLNVGANNAGSSGTINLNGGNLNVGTTLKLCGNYNSTAGINCSGTLTVANGAVTVGGGLDAANNGVLFMDGINGDNTANTGTSTLSLNGGSSLTVAQIQAGNQGTKTINLNGGTIVARPGASSLFMSAANNLTVNVQSGGVTINSGANSITVGSLLGGTGGLTKTGLGTLTLTNANTYGGATAISAGELVGATGGSCSNSAVTVVSGATNGVQVLAANGSWVCGPLTYSAGTTCADFNFGGLAPSTTTAPLQVTTLAFTGTPTVSLRNLVGITNGVYPLIKYGSLSGTPPTTFTSAFASGSLVNDTVHNVLNLVVTQGNSSPVLWAVGNGNWDINTTANWKGTNGATGLKYVEGSSVTFDDTASGTSPIAVALNTTVNPASVTANLTNKTYTIGGTGTIGGSGPLTKNGTGTLILAGTNTYTGGTVVNTGTLEADTNSALAGGLVTLSGGALSNNVSATLANTVNLSAAANTVGVGSGQMLTLSGILTNTGALTKVGAGTLTLNAANTYSGSTTISNGALQLLYPGTIANSSGFVVSSNATLLLNGNGSSWTGFSIPVTLNGGTLSNYNTDNGSYCTPSAAVTVNAASTISVNDGGGVLGNLFLDGGLKGSGALTVNIPAGRTLCGLTLRAAASLYTYSGTMTVNGGVAAVQYNANSGLSVGTANLTNATIIMNATLDLGNATGGMGQANGSAAGQTFYMDALGGSGVVTANFSSSTTRPISLGNNNGSGTFSGVIANGANTVISLIKNGTGTQTLSSANTYTGTTTVNAGTLLANNTSGSGTGTAAVNINSGGTLGGTGTITGAVTNNAGGILLPGATGSGTLTVSNYLTLASGSTSTFAVNGSTPANTSVALGAPATVSYGGVLNIVPTGAFNVGQTFTLFSGAGAANTGNFASIAGSPGAGLAFSFTNGVLSVVSGGALPRAVINSVTVSGGNLILHGTNGAALGTYSVLTNANLALPLSSWTTNSTGSFTAGGTFSISVPVSTQRQLFFSIKQP